MRCSLTAAQVRHVMTSRRYHNIYPPCFCVDVTGAAQLLSEQVLELDRWYTITADRHERQGSLRIDGNSPVTGMMTSRHLNYFRSSLSNKIYSNKENSFICELKCDFNFLVSTVVSCRFQLIFTSIYSLILIVTVSTNLFIFFSLHTNCAPITLNYCHSFLWCISITYKCSVLFLFPVLRHVFRLCSDVIVLLLSYYRSFARPRYI